MDDERCAYMHNSTVHRLQIHLNDFVQIEMLGFIRTDPGVQGSYHTHHFWELIYTYRGAGAHKVGNEVFASKTGDMLLIPPLNSHRFDNLDIDPQDFCKYRPSDYD